ncbi:MAG: hypothetical protein KC466_03600 [Myxococcales bacterium]|nr:hypothetical protein [Myxococcales bacterium]
MAEAALVRTGLTERMIEDGKRLIRELDRGRVRVTGALWLFESDLAEWRLVIVTPFLSSHGPRDVLRRIRAVLKRFEKQGKGLRLRDVYIKDHKDSFVTMLRKIVSTGGPSSLSEIRLSQVVVNGMLIEDALVYRI